MTVLSKTVELIDSIEYAVVRIRIGERWEEERVDYKCSSEDEFMFDLLNMAGAPRIDELIISMHFKNGNDREFRILGADKVQQMRETSRKLVTE